MKSVAGALIAFICVSASSGAGAQGLRGGVGGAASGGFAGTARSGTAGGGISRAPQRSASPQFSRPNPFAAHPQFGMPRGPGLHQIPPVFVPFGGRKFVSPFAPFLSPHFVSPHFHHRQFFPHRQGFVVFGVPEFWGSTIITEVAPGVVRAERGYLSDPSSGARVRESGQLAPFDPTPLEVVDRMMALANLRKTDVVYDLGSGDGRIPITAAKELGARGVGIEIDPALVERARANALAAGVADRVEFRLGDMHVADIRPATVVTLFLHPQPNLKLRPKLRSELRPGARVVSYMWDMGDWSPDEVRRVNRREIFLWRIPVVTASRQNSYLTPILNCRGVVSC